MESEILSTNSNESYNKKKLYSLKIAKHEKILKNYYQSLILYWKILHIILFLFNIPLIFHLCYLAENDISAKCSFYIFICASVIILNLISNFYCLIKLFQNKPIDATKEVSNYCLLFSFCLIFLALILNKRLLGKGVYYFLNNKTNYQKIYEALLMIVFAVLLLTFKMKELFNEDNIPKQYSFLPNQDENQDQKIEKSEEEENEDDEKEEEEKDENKEIININENNNNI